MVFSVTGSDFSKTPLGYSRAKDSQHEILPEKAIVSCSHVNKDQTFKAMFPTFCDIKAVKAAKGGHT